MTANEGGQGSAANAGRMTPALRGVIIIAALLAVISVSVTVTVLVLRGTGWGGQQGEAAPAVASSRESGEEAPAGDEAGEEAPAADSAAILEGAGFDVVMSGAAPEAVETWGGYRLERSTSGRVRVFEGQGPNRATLDGGQWPMSMNSCGMAMYLVVFRSANENVSLDAGLVDSVGTVVDSEETSRGWMLLTKCATPQWTFAFSTDGSNLDDVIYDVHEYRQLASAAGR